MQEFPGPAIGEADMRAAAAAKGNRALWAASDARDPFAAKLCHRFASAACLGRANVAVFSSGNELARFGIGCGSEQAVMHLATGGSALS